MTAIASLDNLIQILAQTGTTEVIYFHRNLNFCSGNSANTYTYTVGAINSLWTTDGFPGRGNAPTTAETCTNLTDGALKQTNPSANKEKFLIGFNFYTPNNGSLILYDRLAHVGNLNTTATTVQTITLTGITRYSGSSSVGNRILVEHYLPVGGSTQRFLEITYTNQDGVSGQKGYCVINAFARTNAFYSSLASGDTGVRSVESVQLLVGGLGGSGGNFGVSIIRPLAHVTSFAKGISSSKDLVVGMPGIPKIENNACLGLLYLPLAAESIEELHGYLTFIEN